MSHGVEFWLTILVKNALGYGNSEGRTVTLWNVSTSTFTALWCPGVVDGEPWFPLFIRRGYAGRLIVA
ncbi:phosphoribosyltransferase-like protein [Bradyrhizobium septentrionale]